MTGRYFESVNPTPEDVARASELSVTECPRRYCWWWRTLSFDWDIPASEGCQYSELPKPAHWLETDKPCCRIDPSIGVDHYEPREPHLEADGFHRYRFINRELRTDRDWPEDPSSAGADDERSAL